MKRNKSLFEPAILIVLITMFLQKSGPPGSLPHLGEGKWGYINKSGQVVLPFRYDEADDFRNGIATVKVNGADHEIDTSGEVVEDNLTPDDNTRPSVKLPPPYDETHDVISQSPSGYVEDVLRVYIYDKATNERTFGYLTKAGQWQFRPRYVAGRDFSEGSAAVNIGGFWSPYGLIGGRWGYINKEGELAIKERYADAKDFSEGVAAVDKAVFVGPFALIHRWRYIDREGKKAIPGTYSDCNSFSEGLAAFNEGGIHDISQVVGGLWGYVDKKGEVVIPPKYTAAREFSEGLAAVQTEGIWTYYSKRLATDSNDDNRLWFAMPQYFHRSAVWLIIGIAFSSMLAVYFCEKRRPKDERGSFPIGGVVRMLTALSWSLLLLSFVFAIYEQPLAISVMFLLSAVCYRGVGWALLRIENRFRNISG